MTVWQLHDNCLMTAWQLPNKCLIAAWRIHEDSLMTYARHSEDKVTPLIKGAFFFRKWDSFVKSPNLTKKLFQKTILSLKFEIPTYISKQLIQLSRSGKLFGIFFFGRLGDLKNESHFLKKATFKDRQQKSQAYETGCNCTKPKKTWRGGGVGIKMSGKNWWRHLWMVPYAAHVMWSWHFGTAAVAAVGLTLSEALFATPSLHGRLWKENAVSFKGFHEKIRCKNIFAPKK